jgi:hypothetical protein
MSFFIGLFMSMIISPNKDQDIALSSASFKKYNPNLLSLSRKFPFRFLNPHIVYAGVAASHQAGIVEGPVLVTVGTVPLAGIVVPLIFKMNRDAVTAEAEDFLPSALPFRNSLRLRQTVSSV